ncbi:acyltransferase family protein [Companilactobacillus halodurans]|uniref:Acyltransferase n=1 Tax=Companilactobacillus halodurans TaxID=2584183 RepID=A0A5P0ZNL3_9LACO|nr:acyltransferase [Companilactobacillus halodurans]MQS75814.1 acyltransferase [Companilactobacillus halodurans]MQS97974.1 acyltransferase [Companilactobacillus halodurans]
MNSKKDTTSPAADIGDYMKVFACTAVMMQTVLSLVLSTSPSFSFQTPIGIIYNLVKFTAPAFIFGILYTTTRTTNQNTLGNYGGYMKKQWSALFVPTIWWTLAYLLIFPNVQQVNKFNSFGSFCWHFINGNAAPHLWYNTMMLQFIILMPLFWALAHWVRNNAKRGLWAVVLTIVVFFAWIYFYDVQVFHGPNEQNWYLLDRLFVSFFIYGVFGVLAWMFRAKFETFIKKSFPILVILFFAVFYWTNRELFSFGYPVQLTNAPYYKPSMTIYALVVIFLVAALAIHHINKSSKALPVFHFLATYAYRAYLSNVFWLQIIWRLGGKTLPAVNPILAIIVCYVLTWILSFTSAYVFHIAWSKVKSAMSRSRVTQSAE